MSRTGLDIRLANNSNPVSPHCEYCDAPLPPKYNEDGSRIPKSGGFWERHMQNCEKRMAHFERKAADDAAREAADLAWQEEAEMDELTLAGFTEEQANAILNIIERKTA